MKTGRAALLSPPHATPVQPGASLQPAHICLALTLAAVLIIHLPTVSAIVTLWIRSATFTHGFLILPVAGWLIWRRRAQLATVARRPWPPGLPLIAALGAVWMLSAVASVQVLQQYCLVLTGIAAVATVLGRALATAIAFPLAYTLLTVPFGEVLMPALIDFTARFTVALLQLIGIPVFHDNNFIALPTGNWAVADACSGLRYLIASLALGMLYAGVNYHSAGKRLIFITISLLLPILANGLRACMVVLIGHWSNMKLASGVDHLIYGWVFFGVVMAMLFWFGAYWRDAEPAAQASATGVAPPQVAPTAQFIRVAVAIVALSAIWPLLAALVLRAPSDATAEPPLTLAAPPAPWRASPMRAGDWHMLHKGRPQRVSQRYSDGQRTVTLQLTWYRHQSEGAELLAQVQRTVVSGAPQWEEVSAAQRTVSVAGRRLAIRQSVQQAANYKLLVWRWYRQGGVETASPQLLKLLLAKAKLSGGNDGGAEIVVAAAYDDQPANAEAAMRDLLAAMLPAIDQGLRHVDR
ncbi:exosortase A [Pseudoduganella sp. FT25W]|uniref:Exosortase A n=1 Tax=Duganella alba TaxID=2666081 RepID=A0A6L5Q9W6_9BURK|nr:exosortase A [Duganella alba]MRX06449.1 exosortase A [Duganella alba]MRX14843.1 exosortase A [Duganella alba]